MSGALRLEVGSWSWNWMEPPLGQLSFFLLCLQYSRAQVSAERGGQARAPIQAEAPTPSTSRLAPVTLLCAHVCVCVRVLLPCACLHLPCMCPDGEDRAEALHGVAPQTPSPVFERQIPHVPHGYHRGLLQRHRPLLRGANGAPLRPAERPRTQRAGVCSKAVREKAPSG